VKRAVFLCYLLDSISVPENYFRYLKSTLYLSSIVVIYAVACRWISLFVLIFFICIQEHSTKLYRNHEP